MSERRPTAPRPVRKVPCPTCGRLVPWGPESPWRPFCSERCRLIDLGEWVEERRGIPGEDGEAPEGGGH